MNHIKKKIQIFILVTLPYAYPLLYTVYEKKTYWIFFRTPILLFFSHTLDISKNSQKHGSIWNTVALPVLIFDPVSLCRRQCLQIVVVFTKTFFMQGTESSESKTWSCSILAIYVFAGLPTVCVDRRINQVNWLVD